MPFPWSLQEMLAFKTTAGRREGRGGGEGGGEEEDGKEASGEK